MDAFHFIGLSGVALYLIAYAALQLGLLRGSTPTYTILNMLAAGCVLISLADDFNLSSFLIQISWIAISVVGLVRMHMADQTLRFSREELDIAEKMLPNVQLPEIRCLMDRGRWETHESGTIVTRQGVPVDDLVFIVSGHAVVARDGRHVGEIPAGSFVGEITCLSGLPATATVVVDSRFHCFLIPAAELRRYLRKRPHVLEQLERAFNRDLCQKLQRSAETIASLSVPRQILAH